MKCVCNGLGCKLCKAEEKASRVFIPVEPMGAVRTTQKQKYTDPRAQRYKAYKDQIKWLLMNRLKFIPAGKAVIITDLIFYMPITASGKVSRKDPDTGKRQLFDVEEGQPHIATPDIDNLIKGLFDAMNGIAWSDDNQVSEIQGAKKVYGDVPGIEFGLSFDE